MLKHYKWLCLTTTCTAALVREATLEYYDGIHYGKARRYQEAVEAARKGAKY